jgi:hypothetical protein
MQRKLYLVSLIIIMLVILGCGDGSQKSPIVQINNWGPQFTQAGKPFNVQPNLNSAIWFLMSGNVEHKDIEAWFGNNKIKNFGIESDKSGSMEIDNSLIAVPGKYPVYLIYVPSKTRIDIGTFEVKP